MGSGSPELLLLSAEELLSLAEQFTMFEPQGMILRGWCLTTLGREDETLLIKRGLAAFRATGSNLWVPFFLTLLADAYGMAGNEEGLSYLDQAARLIEFTQERCTESEVHRVRGKLLSLIGDMSAAAAPSTLAWKSPVADRRGCSSCVLPPVWRGSGATKVSQARRANCSLRSITGSLKVSTRSI